MAGDADNETGKGKVDSTSTGSAGEKKRRRDPFAGMPKISAQTAAPPHVTTLSELKQIKRARVRHEGKRVITDDVKKLKSLAIEPGLPAGEFINYYVEPVRIEYYIPRESRFAIETKYLYVLLIDPDLRPQDEILQKYIESNRFFDLIDVMNEHPQYITSILESYNTTMKLFESVSKAIYDAKLDEEKYKTAFYLCELLIDYEPSIASLEFLGDFISWNLNWLVRRLNERGVEFTASDKVVSYFIKKRNIYWEENHLEYDERFEILAALFFEQAYPNRGLEDSDLEALMNSSFD